MFAYPTLSIQRGLNYFRSGSSHYLLRARYVFCFIALLMPVLSGYAQFSQSSLDAYAKAMSQSTIAERIQGMEKYLAISGNGRLRLDALEVLIWDYTRMGNLAQSGRHAQELIALEPGNAVAVAALNQDASLDSKGQDRARIDQCKAALVQLEHLRKPEGMLDANYQLMRRQTEGVLDGEIGLAYVAEKQYRLARTYLREAVAAQPDNRQYVYALGLALLSGENRDLDNGYWYLARAVDLTRGTQWGTQVAEYAKDRYRKDGGSEADWNTFLTVAANTAFRPSSSPTVATASVETATKNSPGAGSATENASKNATRGASTTTKESIDASAKGTKGLTDQEVQDALMREPPETTEAAPIKSAPKIARSGPNPSVSLGILIQTSLLTHDNRQVILATLRDLVNNMRRGDELCILVFSDQLDFEQDLTADDQLLETAMQGLRPKPGSALLDGIAFAAGHLKRIGRNPNRVLVVISDGRSSKMKNEGLPLSAQVGGVKIDCIGLKVEGADEKALLERLAYYSGGRASFASSPREFRTAAVEAAQNVGIRF